MLDLHESLQLMIMTSTNSNQNYGPPPPITKLTMEQDLKLRQLEIALERDDIDMKDVATVFLALQKQNFVMANSLTNLIDKWPKVQPTINEELTMFGILLGNKN